MAYEQFGVKQLIVRLAERESSDRFTQLGAITVEPATATLALLEQFVRAPSAASLLLERRANQRIADIQVTNPLMAGRAIRDLRLPLDVLIISITRNNSTLISHGYTELEQGDWVSLLGSREGLDQVALQLEA
jgi:Trk K+ transport system NAD-binding subunit